MRERQNREKEQRGGRIGKKEDEEIVFETREKKTRDEKKTGKSRRDNKEEQ